MIAVTGIDVTGSSLLFLVDTERQQLSVYQATAGTDSMMGLKWVGARKIGLDLQVDGWNDKSQYSYKTSPRPSVTTAREAASDQDLDTGNR